MSKKRWRGLIFRYSLALMSLGIISSLFLFLLVYNGYFGELPTEEQLSSIRQQESTRIVSADKVELGRYYLEDRSSISLERVSPHVVNCLIAIEDRRFYDHNGIDYRSLGRVMVKSLVLRNAASGGGSTITQQLAKNLYPRVPHNYLYYAVNKLREMIIARRIEEVYSKEEILNLYLNTVSFGQDIYGIQSASERIYSKDASQLSIGESATLIGMLKASTYFNPLLNPTKSLERRNFILNAMYEANYISEKEYELEKEKPLHTKPSGTRVRHSLYFLQQVEKEANALLTTIDPGITFRTAGLTIESTLDSRLQKYAEEAVTEHLQKLQGVIDRQIDETFWKRNQKILDLEIAKVKNDPGQAREVSVFNWGEERIEKLNTLDSIKYHLEFLQAGLMAMDPGTGKVRAWVGGIDPIYFPNDHVLTKRQVGSTFKPFIYAAALEKNISPCEYFETEAVSYEVKGEEWTPGNAGTVEDEELTMAQALERSVNTVTVKILHETGIDNAISLARNAGIQSEIPEVPSIALGTPSISLREMVESYGIFANEGWNRPSYLIERITDRNGEVLYKHRQKPINRVIKPETALMMSHFLKEVVNSGTGYELRSIYQIKNDVGGKTGTTQNNSDGWFIGVSPALVAGVWVGGEYPAISFNNSTYGQGARMALPVYAGFYERINKDSDFNHISNVRFMELPPHLNDKIDCDPIRAEFRLWEWLKSIGKKRKVSDNSNFPDSTVQKPRLLDRIKGIFRKKKDN